MLTEKTSLIQLLGVASSSSPAGAFLTFIFSQVTTECKKNKTLKSLVVPGFIIQVGLLIKTKLISVGNLASSLSAKYGKWNIN